MRSAQAIAVGLWAVAAVVIAVPTGPQIGQPAPQFTLLDPAGRSVSLADFKGKIVVLEWFDPDCPQVRMHHEGRSTMRDLASRFSSAGVVWLAIHSSPRSSPAANAATAKKWSIDYPILDDAKTKVAKV